MIDQTTGIAAGTPNLEFFENMKRIIEYAKTMNIQLDYPWGAHITVNRFLKKILHEETIELLNVFKNSRPLGISVLYCIDLGYFILTPQGFKIETFKRFEI